MKSSFSFPRRYRIKKPDEFKLIYRHGYVLKGDRIVLFYLPASPGEIKVGFSTGKNIKKAVIRNRSRRLMREAFRINQNKIKRGFNYLFLWRGGVEGSGLEDTWSEMYKLLRRCNLIKK